jgi:hypothetical protein
MTGRIFFGSLLLVILLVLVTATNAIQIHTIEKQTAASFFSYDAMKKMDAANLIVLMSILAKNYPALSEELLQKVKEIEALPISSMDKEDLSITSHRISFGPQQMSDNQTLLEKIYWKIFNYRVFRLYLSTALFLFLQSKLTLMRTTSWAIKLLRWVKIGILLGYITPTSNPPQQPIIVFEQDNENKTLTVTSVIPNTVLWSDIDEIGSGSCDPLPSGNVTVGAKITNCAGIIVLRYIPLNEILGVFEFD